MLEFILPAFGFTVLLLMFFWHVIYFGETYTDAMMYNGEAKRNMIIKGIEGPIVGIIRIILRKEL